MIDDGIGTPTSGFPTTVKRGTCNIQDANDSADDSARHGRNKE